jgi:hypothetical protein
MPRLAKPIRLSIRINTTEEARALYQYLNASRSATRVLLAATPSPYGMVTLDEADSIVNRVWAALSNAMAKREAFNPGGAWKTCAECGAGWTSGARYCPTCGIEHKE